MFHINIFISSTRDLLFPVLFFADTCVCNEVVCRNIVVRYLPAAQYRAGDTTNMAK